MRGKIQRAQKLIFKIFSPLYLPPIDFLRFSEGTYSKQLFEETKFLYVVTNRVKWTMSYGNTDSRQYTGWYCNGGGPS